MNKAYEKRHCIKKLVSALFFFSIYCLSNAALSARHDSKDIQFTDIAKLPESGISYQRTKSDHDALWDEVRSLPKASFFDFGSRAPVRSKGVPGVAVFDFDRDGDLDIYVPNGPGSANSLYENQFAQTKKLTFVDVAAKSGVEATEMDGTGVCYGDTDNDGDYDLYVLGLGQKNKLYVNQGDGSFKDVTDMSEVGGRASYSTACSLGDVNGDGLLDIVIANTTQSWNSAFSPTDHNQLLLNQGENLFHDNTEASGITKLAGFLPEQEGAAGLTWSITMVDYDLDGDIDILMGDDQSAHPVAGVGIPGFVHVMENDGLGNFNDVTVETGLNINGAWMGFSFGDLNADGYLDMFVGNIGDYMNAEYFPYEIGSLASRYFFGQQDGTFVKQEISSETATTFSWGTVMTDYDNDGDSDILYHGSMDGGPLIDASNPGLLLVNDGEGNTTVNKLALRDSGHDRRNVQGLAKGDLNQDGFIDLVTVSNFNIPENVPLIPYSSQWGSDLDDTANYVATFYPVGPGEFAWAGYEFDNGTLAVDINNGANRKGSVSIDLLGTVGLLDEGKSNRDGVGATVTFTPKGGKTAMNPVVAGDSYASQSALTSHFGLGDAKRGTVDVLWPGGTKNRLYDARRGETLIFPEIPCSYDAEWQGIGDYGSCIRRSLKKLAREGFIDRRTKRRLYHSAIKAYVSRS